MAFTSTSSISSKTSEKPETARHLMGHVQMSPWGLKTEAPTTRKFGISRQHSPSQPRVGQVKASMGKAAPSNPAALAVLLGLTALFQGTE